MLDFNDHVRHHLIHLPDIVIRPGGMTWTAGHNGIPVPQSDTEGDEMYVDNPALDLKLTAGKRRVKLGEPLELTWELQNVSDAATWMPGDVSVSDEFAGFGDKARRRGKADAALRADSDEVAR